MRRILEVINLYENAVNFIGDQFSYLSEHGDYEMHLICSEPFQAWKGISIDEFCKKHNVKYQIMPVNRELTPWQDIKTIIGVCKYIRRNKIDTIIGHQTKGIMISMIAGYITSVPHKVILSHGVLTETMTGIKRKLIDFQSYIMHSIADHVICVSNYVKDALSMYGDKVVCLGHGSCTGIDTLVHFNPETLDNSVLKRLKTEYNITEDDFVVGFSGRLVRDKGVCELVDAFKLVRNGYTGSLKLLIVGPSEVRDSIPKETISILRNDQDVVFTGYVDYANIQYYYSLMNVCVLPSYREGLGLAALEAEAMCVPAIVSDHTGCKETIINNETGFYCKLSGESIADAIHKLLDKNISRSMGVNARKFVSECFDCKIVHENILQYLNSMEK